MRAVEYTEARRILRKEGEGGHTKQVEIPKCVQRGITAIRISDGSVFVLCFREIEGVDRYVYERYAEGEIG